MDPDDLATTRRAFLAGSTSLLLASGLPAFPQSSRARIDVILDELQGRISPDNFGYLLEVIGSSIYDGVWVGEKSRIPNVGGIRKELIGHLRQINASVIRWPGGCFADSYDWRDGIGARGKRPRRTSFWNDKFKREVPIGPQRFDPNHFGTDELMRLCKLTRARPFLNANTRSLAAQDFDRWVEYCNSPAGSTTLADERARNGSHEPHGVRYWGIGNEVWGLDGGMSLEEYLETYKRFAYQLPVYGEMLHLVACGAPSGLSLKWVEQLMDGLYATQLPTPVSAISVHWYAGNLFNDLTTDQTLRALLAEGVTLTAPEALKFDESGWYHMLGEYDRIEHYIEGHWQILGVRDPKHEVKLALDEWGAICAKGTELSSTNYWSRAVTLRDVLGAALTLDIFNRHCEKISVACFTGLINQEGGLFITEGDKFLATGIYHVFQMYAPHQGAELVRTEFTAPSIDYHYNGKAKSIWGLKGSASLKGKTLTLTVVNSHAREPQEATINLRGARVKSARLVALAHTDIHAMNTFEVPDALRPIERAIEVAGASFTCAFTAASVNRLTLELT
jgi:alpha-L-arabinofuranosidase